MLIASLHLFIYLLLLLPELPTGVKLPQAVKWHKNSYLTSWHSQSSDKGQLSCALVGQSGDGSAHVLLLPLSSSIRVNICSTTLRVGKKRKEKIPSVVERSSAAHRRKCFCCPYWQGQQREFQAVALTHQQTITKIGDSLAQSIVGFILNICVQKISTAPRP